MKIQQVDMGGLFDWHGCWSTLTPDQPQTPTATFTFLDEFSHLETTDPSLCDLIGQLLYWLQYIWVIYGLRSCLWLSVITVVQINSTNLCKVVKDVDTVLIPAEDPTILEETLEQAKLSLGWTVRPGWTRKGKQLKMRNLIPKTDNRWLKLVWPVGFQNKGRCVEGSSHQKRADVWWWVIRSRWGELGK